MRLAGGGRGIFLFEPVEDFGSVGLGKVKLICFSSDQVDFKKPVRDSISAFVLGIESVWSWRKGGEGKGSICGGPGTSRSRVCGGLA